MSALELGLVLAAACYAVLHGAARLVAAFLARTVRPARPQAWFALAVLPTLGPLALAVGVALPCFLAHEPVRFDEWPGAVLCGLAALAVLHLSWVVVRGARLLGAAWALRRRWMRNATPLDHTVWGLPAFAVDAGQPTVALAGIVRPRLFVDRRVLAACTREELAAIAAHERAHAAARDNLRRLLADACCGPHSALARAWRRAAETAADARAATSPGVAVALAGALVRVSRLRVGPRMPAAALSAIHEGEGLEARVRHLLAPRPGAVAHGAPRWWFAAVGAGAMLAWTGSERVHALLEFFVHALP